MKPLLRVILNALTVLSLALCVATVGGLLASFAQPVGFDFLWRRQILRLEVGRGQLVVNNSPEVAREESVTRMLSRARARVFDREMELFDELHKRHKVFLLEFTPKGANEPLNISGPAVLHDLERDEPLRRELGVLGNQHMRLLAGTLKYTVRPWSRGSAWIGVTFAALFALTPMLRQVSRWQFARWKKRGVCAACRYNLTGNVSGVCPECGTAVVKGTA